MSTVLEIGPPFHLVSFFCELGQGVCHLGEVPDVVPEEIAKSEELSNLLYCGELEMFSRPLGVYQLLGAFQP